MWSLKRVKNPQSTYSFVPNDADGESAANGQLTGPGHGSPLDALEHTKLLNGIPTKRVKHKTKLYDHPITTLTTLQSRKNSVIQREKMH